MCSAGKGYAEVRIIILPTRAGRQTDTSVKSFKRVETQAEYATRFQRVEDSGLKGKRYFAPNVPWGNYEVRLSLGEGEPDITRTVTVESSSESLYFGSDVTDAHIAVLDPAGDLLKDVAVDKVLDSFGTDYSKSFKGKSAATLPSGVYQLEVVAPGFGIARGHVCFCDATSWAVLGVSVPGGDTVYPDATVRLKGKVQLNRSIDLPVVIRMRPAYTDSSMSAVLPGGSDGTFAVSGAALPGSGDYVVLVSQAGRILGSGVFRLPLTGAASLPLMGGGRISIESENNGSN